MPFFQRLATTLTKALQPGPTPEGRVTGGGHDINPSLGRRPEVGEFTDLITTVAEQWTLPRCRRTLNDHDQGQFQDSSLLIDYMVRDDRIASSLNTRIIGLQGLPQRIAPSDDKSAESRAVAAALEADWEWIAPPSAIEDLLRWEAMQGFALDELIWDTHRDRWIPRLKFWHPQFVYYRLDLRKYVAISQEGLAYVTPGDGKWLLFSRHGHYRAWMQGAVRALFVPWFLRQQSWRDWGRYNEIHGTPMRQAVVPASASTVDKANFFSMVRTLGSMATFLAPRNKDGERFAIELVEAANHQSWEAFERAMLKGDSAIQLELLGQNLSGGDEKGGSLAKAKVAENVRSDFTSADANVLARDFYVQVIRAWTVYNFGDESLTPRAIWDATPPEDAAKGADTFLKVMQASQIAQTIYGTESLDTEQLIERFAVPLKPEAEMQPAPTAGAPDGPASEPDQAEGAHAGAAKDPSAALNGAQVGSLLEIIQNVAAGSIPRTTGIELLVTSFPISREQAESIMGDVGAGFNAAPPPGTASRMLSQRSDPSAHAQSGQLYVDRVADRAITAGSAAFSAEVMKHVDDALRLARDFDELKQLLLHALPGMHPDRFERVVDGATSLALAAGTFTARKEATP